MKSLKFLFPLLFGVLLGIQGAQAQEPDCSDTWTDAAEGSFTDGFTFAFTFAEGDLTLDVELLDEQIGLVAYAQTMNPDFVETVMTNVGGQAFSITFPDQTEGNDFNVAVKFAYAGGLVTSTMMNYVVGADCDVLGGGGNEGGLSLPITFEEDIDYGIVDFGENVSEIVADPTDGSNTVVQSLKTDGSEPWAGTTVAEGIGFAEPLPFEEGATTMTVRVWSPTAGIPVRLKVENLTDPTVSVETEATVTEAEVWQTLTFDFANQAPGTAPVNFASVYTKASVFFDFDTPGAGLTYFWDDVTFGEGDDPEPADPLELPITFEEDIDYGIVDFGGNVSEIVADPTDASNTVVQSLKTDGSEPWAGTTVADGIGFAEPLPFEEGATTMTVRVWSPTAGIPVRLKVENLTDPTVSVETEATVTEAEVWQTLTFDFANQAPGTAPVNFASVYTKASVFFDFDTPGAGLTYFWDDVTFGGEAPEPVTVWDIINESPDHTTLASALTLAGLDETLQGEGLFTVFAPTNAAFDAVDTDLLNDLLADPQGSLTEVLLYHVLGSSVFSGDLSDGLSTATLQGEAIEVSIDGGSVFINDAEVTDPDLEADNGVVHVIDAVLLPPSFTVSVTDLDRAANPGVLAPNPASEVVNLMFAGPLTELHNVTVFDINGRQVKSFRINAQQTEINTSDLNAGTYIVTIQNGESRYFQKLVITR